MPTTYKTEDILNPASDLYQKEQPFFARPGETTEQYMTRTGIKSSAAKELTGASSESGLSLVKEAEKKATGLQAPVLPPTEPVAPPEKEPTKGEFTLDEALEIFGTDFTGINKQDDGKYSADPSAMARIGLKTDAVTGIEEKQRLLKEKADYENAIARIQNFDVSQDPALKNILSGIESSWNSRIAQMNQVNKSRTAAQQTAAYRYGVQYTGAQLSPLQGIVSAEENAGLNRITELEAQKNSALTEAKMAYSNNEFSKYVKFVEIADKKYQQSLDAVNILNETIKSEDAKRALAQTKRESQNTITGLMLQGVTDPLSIFNAMTASGMPVDFKDITEITSEMRAADKTLPGIVGEWLSAKENAPEFADTTLEEYMNFKDPGKALALKEQMLRIQKLQKEAVGGMLDTNDKIVTTKDDARKLNQEIVKNDAYKVIRKGQDSLQYLIEFEKAFEKYGLETIPGPAKGDLSTKYQTSLLNLKEFFNLGVLNGPDLEVLAGILPNPTVMTSVGPWGLISIPKKFAGIKSKVTAGITSLKENIGKTLDDRYASLSTQYGDYSPDSVTVLKDLNRLYVQQKAVLDDNIQTLIDENPQYTDEDIIKVIQTL